MSDYSPFDITVHHTGGGTFAVSATAPVNPHRAAETIVIDLDDPAFRDPLRTIDAEQTDQELFRAFGERLFKALFVGQVRTLYTATLADARANRANGRKGVRIGIAISEPARDLYRLPWMLAFDASVGWLGSTNASIETPLSYRADELTPRHLQPLKPPLSLLVVAASPTGSALPPIDASRELTEIRNALGARVTRGEVVIDTLLAPELATRDAIRRKIEASRPHVLHFIGHGPQSRHTAFNSPVLLLQHANGTPDPCSIEVVLKLLEPGLATLRLVVLNACNTDGAAWKLAEHGIATIGMRYDIYGRASEAFSEGFYESLAAGLPIDSAANAARSAIFERYNEHERAWFAPVVFLPLPFVELTLLSTPRPEAVETRPAEPEAVPAPPGARQTAIEVTSQPPRATVFLNGVARSKTPARLAVTPGEYRVHVASGWHSVWPGERWVVAEEGATVRVRIDRLRRRWLPPGWYWPLVAALLAVGGQHLWQRQFGTPSGMVAFAAGEYAQGGEDTPLIRLMRKYAIANLDFLIEEAPATASLDAFYIDRDEVTNQQYRVFLAGPSGARSHVPESGEPPGKSHVPSLWADRAYNQPGQPVVGVDWYDATAYCASIGGRLPTGDEWERAARGVQGRLYPWGDAFDPSRANVAESQATAPVPGGRFPAGASEVGAVDLVGNVSEWTSESKPVGGQKGAVVRGGAWNEQGEIYGLAFLKPSTTLDYRGPNVGFRCVKAATGAGALPGMVLVPAGAFRKGSEDTRALRLGRQFRLSGTAIRQLIEAPAGRKRIEAFALDAHEVTIDEYRRFIATRGTDHSGCSSAERAAFPSGKDHTPDPSAWNDAAFNQPDQPVVGVDWYDAFAYCRSQQKRLPTEREWEAAARGREGRAYPWGDRFESDRCNAADSTQPLGRTSPVGSLRACRSPEGVYDLVGNADEWTASYAAGGTTGSSRYRTRGGSWAESGELRGLGYFAFVAEATYRRTDMGIRCAADLEPSWIERLMR